MGQVYGNLSGGSANSSSSTSPEPQSETPAQKIKRLREGGERRRAAKANAKHGKPANVFARNLAELRAFVATFSKNDGEVAVSSAHSGGRNTINK